MTLTQLFVAELEREAPRARRALEQVPLDRDDWTPHPNDGLFTPQWSRGARHLWSVGRRSAIRLAVC
jgi:hypothetical protein